jgi:dienelactone hydrolase
MPRPQLRNRFFVVALLLFFAGSVLADEKQHSGPWNVPQLLDAPTPITVLSTDGNLRSITFPSQPYRGRETQVFAYYAVPKQPAKGPYPAMLLVHGGGGTAFAEWAKLWADRGYVALAMDLAGVGPDGKRLEAGGPPQDDDTKFKATETGPLTDAWPYQAVAAVLRGHALLAQQPEVDKDRIGITGISWGGYLTCIVAGIDPRLKVAVPVYGCGFLADNSAWKDSKRFEQLSPEARERWIKNFDPSQYLAGVSCPILFVNGTNDFAYPLDSYRKSYELVKSPRTLCVTVNMRHGHQAGWAPPEIGAFVDSVLKSAPPLVTLSPLAIDDSTAHATATPGNKLTQAELHFTTDTGRWQDRKWASQPAKIDAAGEIRAQLPATRPLSCFLTAKDDRGLIVSTQHVELER